MKYIVFDFDGTLHDTSNLYLSAFRKVETQLLHEGIITDLIPTSQVLSYIGDSPKAMWNNYLPHKSFDEISHYSKQIGAYMIEGFKNNKSHLYEGVLETLENLNNKGYKLLILSNCKNEYMDQAKVTFKLDKYFIDYFTSEAYNDKPKTEIMKVLIDKYPGSHIMIGDRYHDIHAGLDNNLRTIHCTYGFSKKNETTESVEEIQSIKDLQIIL